MMIIANDQRVPARHANLLSDYPMFVQSLDELSCTSGGRDEEYGLILAEEHARSRSRVLFHSHFRANLAGKRHLSNSDGKPAVRNVVHGSNAAFSDQLTDGFAGATLGVETDRWW